MRLPFLLIPALLPGSLAGYTIVCRDTTGATRIEAAIQEAIKVAKNAHDKIADLTKDTTKAAFEPLFEEGDVTTLRTLYERVYKVATNPLQVTFYCDNSFVDWSDGLGLWIDTAYTYKAKDPDNGREITKSVSAFRLGEKRERKPGATGSSFSTLGYKKRLLNDEIADFSDQAHISVASKRWNPPSGDDLDHRSMDTVNKDGLLEGYTALDQFKPLSETILHELIHVVGGTVAPNEGPKRITDIPIDAVGGKSRIYGYEKSVRLNQLRRNPVVITQGSPTTRADPITILAKALYLQIEGKPTYWSTGVIDKDTYQAAGLPGRSDDSNPSTGTGDGDPSTKRAIPWHG